MRKGYIFKKVDCPSCIAASGKLAEIKSIPNIEWKEIILPGTASDHAEAKKYNIQYVPTVVIEDPSNYRVFFGFDQIMNNAAQIISGKTTVDPDSGPNPVPVSKKDNKLIWIAAAIAAIIILND